MGMWNKIKQLFAAARDLARSTAEHELLMNAAASAFFLFLSIPPALLSLVSSVSLVPVGRWTESTTLKLFSWAETGLAWLFPEVVVNYVSLGMRIRLQPSLGKLEGMSPDRVLELIRDLISTTLPPELAQAVMGIVSDILGNPRQGLLTVSFVTILWSAAGATRSSMRALASIYEVDSRSIFTRNLVSLGLTVGFLVVWTLSMALIPVSNTMAQVLVEYSGLDQGVLMLWSGFNWSVGAGLLLGSVLVLNRFGPGVPLRMGALVPGSLLTLVLWVGSSYGLGIWMERSWDSYNTTYGTLSVVIVLLVWCYLLSIGLLLGAEVNTALLRLRRGGLAAAGESDLKHATQVAVEGQIEAIPFLEESARKRGVEAQQKQ